LILIYKGFSCKNMKIWQTVSPLIRWLLMEPSDQDLHCLQKVYKLVSSTTKLNVCTLPIRKIIQHCLTALIINMPTVQTLIRGLYLETSLQGQNSLQKALHANTLTRFSKIVDWNSYTYSSNSWAKRHFKWVFTSFWFACNI